MADVKTLLQLRTLVRQRADMEDTQFITDAEANGYINDSIRLVHNILVETFEDEYFHATVDIPSVSNQQAYALPAAFFKLLGVDVASSTSLADKQSLKKYMFQERNTRTQRARLPYDFQYRLRGNNLHIIPAPGSGITFTVHYIPKFTDLALDTDTYDGISGFEELVVVDAAIKCLRKEESDTAELMAEKQMLIDAVKKTAAQRDITPGRIVDVENIDFDEGRWWR